MIEKPTGTTLPPDDADYVVFDPVAYAHALWRRRLSLLLVPLLVGAAFYALSYTQQKKYQSVVRFMPPKPAVGGLLLLSRGGGSGDEYRAELGSRTVGLDVVRRLHLVERLKVKDETMALRSLAGISKFATDSNAFVTITVTTTDPNLSAEIANEFYAALGRFGTALSEHESEHRLNYMAGPLQIEQRRLQLAEEELAAAQSRTGLVAPTAQASLGLQQVATLRNRISELQATLATAQVGATNQNPQVVALQSQINNLTGQLHTLESKNEQANSPANLPGRSLAVVRREREVAFHTATLEALTRSMGTAQITESYTPSLSLIEDAIPAKEKYSPSRRLWALLGFLVGAVLTLLQIALTTAWQEWAASDRGRIALARWKQSWHDRSVRGAAGAQ